MCNFFRYVLILLGGLIVLALPYAARAQSTSASATAIVATALQVSKTADFNFGRIVPGATVGTVLLSTSGTRSQTGGVTLGNAGSTSAAAFSVSGENNATFTVTFSGGTLSDGASPTNHTMSVSAFVVKMSGGTDQLANYAGTLSGAGTQTFAVGGTLSVGTTASTPAGTYTTSNSGGTAVSVTVAYN